MCIIIDGELREKKRVKTSTGKSVEILRILAMVGRTEQFIEVANFSDGKPIPEGKVRLSVVPRVNVASSGRAYLNWATFEGELGEAA
jgi:hypothetical protein